jgi:hypothetical protein
MHCDGFGDSISDNCIPAGENLTEDFQVHVTDRR